MTVVHRPGGTCRRRLWPLCRTSEPGQADREITAWVWKPLVGGSGGLKLFYLFCSLRIHDT